MSLNNITLSPHLLAALYPNVLVESTATVMPLKVPLPMLGGNKQHILIVVQKDEVAFLPENELIFLTAILAACKLSLDDVGIINWNSVENKDYKYISQIIPYKKVLLFGITPDEIDLPVAFPEYQVQNFDSVTYMHAPHLTEIANNIDYKKMLWNALQKIFSTS